MIGVTHQPNPYMVLLPEAVSLYTHESPKSRFYVGEQSRVCDLEVR